MAFDLQSAFNKKEQNKKKFDDLMNLQQQELNVKKQKVLIESQKTASQIQAQKVKDNLVEAQAEEKIAQAEKAKTQNLGEEQANLSKKIENLSKVVPAVQTGPAPKPVLPSAEQTQPVKPVPAKAEAGAGAETEPKDNIWTRAGKGLAENQKKLAERFAKGDAGHEEARAEGKLGLFAGLKNLFKAPEIKQPVQPEVKEPVLTAEQEAARAKAQEAAAMEQEAVADPETAAAEKTPVDPNAELAELFSEAPALDAAEMEGAELTAEESSGIPSAEDVQARLAAAEDREIDEIIRPSAMQRFNESLMRDEDISADPGAGVEAKASGLPPPPRLGMPPKPKLLKNVDIDTSRYAKSLMDNSRRIEASFPEYRASIQRQRLIRRESHQALRRVQNNKMRLNNMYEAYASNPPSLVEAMQNVGWNNKIRAIAKYVGAGGEPTPFLHIIQNLVGKEMVNLKDQHKALLGGISDRANLYTEFYNELKDEYKADIATEATILKNVQQQLKNSEALVSNEQELMNLQTVETALENEITEKNNKIDRQFFLDSQDVMMKRFENENKHITAQADIANKAVTARLKAREQMFNEKKQRFEEAEATDKFELDMARFELDKEIQETDARMAQIKAIQKEGELSRKAVMDLNDLEIKRANLALKMQELEQKGKGGGLSPVEKLKYEKTFYNVKDKEGNPVVLRSTRWKEYAKANRETRDLIYDIKDMQKDMKNIKMGDWIRGKFIFTKSGRERLARDHALIAKMQGLTGKFRLKVIGPGAMSDFEQQILKDYVGAIKSKDYKLIELYWKKYSGIHQTLHKALTALTINSAYNELAVTSDQFVALDPLVKLNMLSEATGLRPSEVYKSFAKDRFNEDLISKKEMEVIRKQMNQSQEKKQEPLQPPDEIGNPKYVKRGK